MKRLAIQQRDLSRNRQLTVRRQIKSGVAISLATFLLGVLAAGFFCPDNADPNSDSYDPISGRSWNYLLHLNRDDRSACEAYSRWIDLPAQGRAWKTEIGLLSCLDPVIQEGARRNLIEQMQKSSYARAQVEDLLIREIGVNCESADYSLFESVGRFETVRRMALLLSGSGSKRGLGVIADCAGATLIVHEGGMHNYATGEALLEYGADAIPAIRERFSTANYNARCAYTSVLLSVWNSGENEEAKELLLSEFNRQQFSENGRMWKEYCGRRALQYIRFEEKRGAKGGQ